MRSIVVLWLSLGLLLSGIPAVAQESPKSIANIYEVQIGMPRDQVLAALRERYELKRRTAIIKGELEAWDAYKKELPVTTNTIIFHDGKVVSVVIGLYAPMAGEAVQFADRLYQLLYDEAAPRQDRVGAVLNLRDAKVSVQLHALRGEEYEERRMFLNVNQDVLRVTISRWLNGQYPPTVTIARIKGKLP